MLEENISYNSKQDKNIQESIYKIESPKRTLEQMKSHTTFLNYIHLI